jgi:hypothetical protein
MALSVSRLGERGLLTTVHTEAARAGSLPTGIFGTISLIGKLSQQLCSQPENIRQMAHFSLAHRNLENVRDVLKR